MTVTAFAAAMHRPFFNGYSTMQGECLSLIYNIQQKSLWNISHFHNVLTKYQSLVDHFHISSFLNRRLKIPLKISVWAKAVGYSLMAISCPAGESRASDLRP